MNFIKLQKLKDRNYFSVADLARVLGIRPSSANVLASRYARKGLLVRLKKGYYVLPQKWDSLSKEGHLSLANFMQVPSYVSLMTALSYHGITTQLQRDYFESISLRRSKSVSIRDASFRYFKIKKRLFSGFIKKDGIFIAAAEKALVDALYLHSMNRYSIDVDSLAIEKLNKKKVIEIVKKYPLKTRKAVRRLCKI